MTELSSAIVGGIVVGIVLKYHELPVSIMMNYRTKRYNCSQELKQQEQNKRITGSKGIQRPDAVPSGGTRI